MKLTDIKLPNENQIMRVLLLACLILAALSLSAQVKPNDFPEETSPTNANFEVYSQKNGVNKKASLDAIKNYILGGATIGSGSIGPQGPKGEKGDKGDDGIGIAQNLQNAGRIGDTMQVINITDGTGVTFNIADRDNDPEGELQEYEIDSVGDWSLSIGGGSGSLLDHYRSDNDTLRYFTDTLYLNRYINNVYDTLSSVSELSTLEPTPGSIAIIDSAGILSIAFYQDTVWTDPIILNSQTVQYELVSGTTTATIWATGTDVTLVENQNAGEVTISIPENVELLKLNIKMSSSAVDNDNHYYMKLDYEGLRSYNTAYKNINMPSVLVSSAETASMSRQSPILISPTGNAGVDIGVSAFGGGDGSDLEIAVKDFFLASNQFITLNFSNR